MELLACLPTTKSGLPSLSKSPEDTSTGLLPTANDTPPPERLKLVLPDIDRFRSKYKLPSEFVTAMSGRPSLSKSAIAKPKNPLPAGLSSTICSAVKVKLPKLAVALRITVTTPVPLPGDEFLELKTRSVHPSPSISLGTTLEYL